MASAWDTLSVPAKSVCTYLQMIHSSILRNFDEPCWLCCLYSFEHIFLSPYVKKKESQFRKEGLAKCFFLALAGSLFCNCILLGHISPRVLENSLVEVKHLLFTVENRIFNCNLWATTTQRWTVQLKAGYFQAQLYFCALRTGYYFVLCLE